MLSSFVLVICKPLFVTRNLSLLLAIEIYDLDIERIFIAVTKHVSCEAELCVVHNLFLFVLVPTMEHYDFELTRSAVQDFFFLIAGGLTLSSRIIRFIHLIFLIGALHLEY